MGTATTESYTLSLHDALPISRQLPGALAQDGKGLADPLDVSGDRRPIRLPAVGAHEEIFVHRHLSEDPAGRRSEEHTSELQSHHDRVCRLLLEKKKHN